MKIDNLIDRRGIAWLPMVMFLAFAISYSLSQILFVECPTSGLLAGIVHCDPVRPADLVPELKDRKRHDEQAPPPEVRSKRESARFIWMFFTSAYTLIVWFALAGFSLLISHWINWKTASAALGIALTVGMAISFLTNSLPIAGPVFEGTIQVGYGGIWNIILVAQWINGFGIAVVIIMSMTLTAILYADETGSRANRLRLLNEKRNHLSLLLYLSTFLLILGLFRGSADFSWAKTFLSEGSANVIKELLSNVSTVLGGFYTLLIACTYLPAAYIIQRRAENALGRNVGDTEAELKKLGFTFSFSDAIPRILAIAGPFLTGAVGDYLAYIPKLGGH
jgi:hypothetical protein